jgi:hypothetical protein
LQTVNFVFLIVGHTANAADHLFNSLKHKYQKNDIYTMQALIKHLSTYNSVRIWPSKPNNFFNYDALFSDIYHNISEKVKQNHNFSCSNNCLLPIISLQESNLDEHQVSNHAVSKKTQKFNNAVELVAHLSTLLLPINCLGLNPYKKVEMWKNYRPMVPIEFQDDSMYSKPDAKTMAKVKDKKIYQVETRVVL